MFPFPIYWRGEGFGTLDYKEEYIITDNVHCIIWSVLYVTVVLQLLLYQVCNIYM